MSRWWKPIQTSKLTSGSGPLVQPWTTKAAGPLALKTWAPKWQPSFPQSPQRKPARQEGAPRTMTGSRHRLATWQNQRQPRFSVKQTWILFQGESLERVHV